MRLGGTMGMDRWSSVSAAITAGQHSSLPARLNKCLPRTLEWVPMFEYYRGPIPLAFMVVKAAFESCGAAEAGEKKMTDIGLFQLFPVHLRNRGYSPTDGLDPDVNTRIFADLVRARGESFARSHGSYFPSGEDWSYWGIAWLSAAIGPGATRHLLNQIPPGPNAFGRLADFVEGHPSWMERPEQDAKWGNQSGRLVAFRVMVAREAMKRIRSLEEGGDLLAYLQPYSPPAGAGPGSVPGAPGRVMGVILAIASMTGCASLLGWSIYTALRRMT